MGARWSWYARCPNGHIYSNFSGGADPCDECGLTPIRIIDCPHWMVDEENCDCAERIKEAEPILIDWKAKHDRLRGAIEAELAAHEEGLGDIIVRRIHALLREEE